MLVPIALESSVPPYIAGSSHLIGSPRAYRGILVKAHRPHPGGWTDDVEYCFDPDAS